MVRELEAEAQKEYFGRIQALEEEKQKTQARLQELQKAQAARQIAQILSAEQQAELERFKKTYIETNLALKELRKNLRQDAEALVFWTKVANIALMPLLVALPGCWSRCSAEGTHERPRRRHPGRAARCARRRRAALPAAGARAPAGKRRRLGRTLFKDLKAADIAAIRIARAERHAYRAAQRRALGDRRARRFPADLPRCASSCSR